MHPGPARGTSGSVERVFFQGHRGAIFGYQDTAYWNQDTGRMVILATSMYPTPTTAQTPLANATDNALCAAIGATRPGQGDLRGQGHARTIGR